jgi:hypothetical protein
VCVCVCVGVGVQIPVNKLAAAGQGVVAGVRIHLNRG